MPIGTLAALWVLVKKVKGDSIKYYLLLGIAWTLIAIVFDYFLLVKAFHPADGYYKLDVYLYYALTFLLPPLVGWLKKLPATRNLSSLYIFTMRSRCKNVLQKLWTIAR